MSTISAIRENDAGQFDGSATPDLALIDSEYRDVIWIDVKHPSTWDKKVYDQLAEAWRSSEGIGYYYENELEDEDLKQTEDSLKTIPVEYENQKEIELLQKRLDSLKALESK